MIMRTVSGLEYDIITLKYYGYRSSEDQTFEDWAIMTLGACDVLENSRRSVSLFWDNEIRFVQASLEIPYFNRVFNTNTVIR